MAEPIRVVVIEDEAPIRRFLRAGVGPDEVAWIEAATGEEGVRLVAQRQPDVVLLDLGLPDQDGLDVLRGLREWTDVPVIVLTARGQESDKVLALDAGADDYVTKPFSLAELMARVRAAVRRAHVATVEPPSVVQAGDLRVDLALRRVFQGEREIRLTPTEYRLLALLAGQAGRVLTHRHLLREIWGPEYEDATHTLRVHMASLRQKIEPDPVQPRYVRTETGVGYRFLVG
ncbi:MAG: response regulator [Fimbriimonadaceae bacterium]|nr:response regulator [Fimbriimonadaceae bacterium]